MPEAATRSASRTTVAFGDVVRQVKDKVDPEESGLERYVAGEHMSTDDLRIRRWGEIGDDYLGPAFHMRFKPGHVLYGSRRTYLRKVALADFEGITANTTYVLESKDPDTLLPGLLPFIMQAESFHAHSKRESKGSVNPYVNFSDLAWYEFALPPLAEQRRIADVMRSVVATREGFFQALEKLEGVLRRLLIDSYATMSSRFDLVSLDAFGEATMGRQKSPKYRTGKSPFPYLRVANIGSLELRLDKLEEMDFTPVELEKFRLIPGDILLSEGDIVSEFNVGRPSIFRGEVADCCFQNTLIRFRPNSQMDPMFVLALFEGARLNFVFAKASKTTTVTHLGLGRFKEVRLPMPDEVMRTSLASELSRLLEARRALRIRLLESQQLIGTVLSGALQ